MKKVLLVDDSQLSIDGLVQNIDFQQLGLDIAAVCLDSESALDHLNREEVDIVISDIRMPNLTGLDLARYVIPRHKQTKIILISAFDDFEYAQEALRIGVFDYIQKPIDYAYLQRSIQKALDSVEVERALYRQLQDIKPYLEAKLYMDLLHSYPESARVVLSKNMDYLDIKPNQGPYICLALFPSQENVDKERTLIENIGLQNYMQKFFGKYFFVKFIQEFDKILAVLSPVGDCDDFYNLILRISNDFVHHCEQTSISVFVMIGVPVDTLWEISISYQSTAIASNFLYFREKTQIFEACKAAVLQNGSIPIDYLCDLENDLVNVLLMHSHNQLESFIERFEKLLLHYKSGKEEVIACIQLFAARLLSYFSDNKEMRNHSTDRINHFLMDIRAKSDAREIINQFSQLGHDLIDAIHIQSSSYHARLIHDVVRYIESHYACSELRLEDVAKAFHINSNHLSRVFKREKGVSFSDYLSEVRLLQAQKLLSASTMRISEISQETGYASQYYFSQCFKKRFGVTPSQYRTTKED